MTTGFGVDTLKGLAELLSAGRDNEEDQELDAVQSPYVTPASIGPTSTSSSVAGGAPSTSTSTSTALGALGPSKDIWSSEEVKAFDYEDGRPQPEYDVVFKQAVSAEDVFLGMGLKSPTTASCEKLLVKVKLPGTQLKEVELDVTKTFLDCRTPKYRLGLHLPHPVDPKTSSAKWLSEAETLEVELRLNRDYEYLNS